jgi:hypothetical protein
MTTERVTDCPHNSGLICEPDARNCKTCGWSPEVSEARRKALRESTKPKQVQEPEESIEPDKTFRNYVGAERPERTTTCTRCGKTFRTRAPRVLYCESCRGIAQAETIKRSTEKAKQRREEAKALDKG